MTKEGEAEEREAEDRSILPDGPEADVARRYFSDRYGVPEAVLDRFRFEKRGQDFWMWSGDAPAALRDGRHKVQQLGLRAMRRVMKTWKPTVATSQILGRYATRNTVELDAATFEKLIEAEVLAVGVPGPPEAGYVIVKADGIPIGCGFWTPDGRLRSLIPKRRFR